MATYTGQGLINEVMQEVGEATSDTSFRALVLNWLQEGLDTLLLDCQGYPFTEFRNTFNTVASQANYAFSLANFYSDEIIAARLTNPDTPLTYVPYSELMRSALDLELEGTPESYYLHKWDSTDLHSELYLYPIPSESDLEIEVLYRIKSYLLADTSAVIPFPRHILSILKKYARGMAYQREGDFNNYKFNLDIFFKQIAELKKQRLSKAQDIQASSNELGFNLELPYNYSRRGRFGISNAIAGVSSVGIVAPSFLSVSGSPISTSGDITLSLASQTANMVFAAPNGSNGSPTFRLLVANDLPTHTHTVGEVVGAGAGTVTSVACTVPTGFTVTGSPITTSGTLAISLDNQSGNKVLASPTNGSSGTPAFRALVAADIPDISATYSTKSAGGDLSGTLPSPTVAKINGVTLGSTTATSANILIADGSQWVTRAVSGDITISNAGVTAIGALKVTNAMLAGSIESSKLVGTDIATVGTITSGTWNGTTISVANGGSGATTLTGILIGNGTSAFTALALGAGESIRRNAGNTAYEAFTPGVGGGSTAFNDIGDSTAAGTVANANYNNEWSWNSLAGITGLKLSSNSTAAASNTQILFECALSGANATSSQTTTTVKITNTHTGTSSKNVALDLTASGGSTNYALLTGGGHIGVGTSTPSVIINAFDNPTAGTILQSAGFLSSQRTGQVGFHMFNNGGVAEWIVTQPASATSSNFRINKVVSNVQTVMFELTTDGVSKCKAFAQDHYDAGNSSTSFTLNWNNGGSQKVTLTGNVTSITLSNPVAGSRYIIYLHTGTGSFTVTGWPAAVKWPAGTAPTITTTASKVDKIILDYDGTSYYAQFAQNY